MSNKILTFFIIGLLLASPILAFGVSNSKGLFTVQEGNNYVVQEHDDWYYNVEGFNVDYTFYVYEDDNLLFVIDRTFTVSHLGMSLIYLNEVAPVNGDYSDVHEIALNTGRSYTYSIDGVYDFGLGWLSGDYTVETIMYQSVGYVVELYDLLGVRS